MLEKVAYFLRICFVKEFQLLSEVVAYITMFNIFYYIKQLFLK